MDSLHLGNMKEACSTSSNTSNITDILIWWTLQPHFCVPICPLTRKTLIASHLSRCTHSKNESVDTIKARSLPKVLEIRSIFPTIHSYRKQKQRNDKLASNEKSGS